MVKEIESRIRGYFVSLEIPPETTIYDRLLLSLRPKDAVLTFNWDPFLFDSYERLRHIAPLPGIYFLHGNVRIGACKNHLGNWGRRNSKCPICFKIVDDVPLLYPVERKDYSSNPYIKDTWDEAKMLIREAFVLTVFGYGAPSSDVDAVELLKSAWFDRSDRKIEHIEVIDLACHDILYERWKPFLPTHHLKAIRCFDQSWVSMYPRRSVEALEHSVKYGRPSEQFPLMQSSVLHEVCGDALEIIGFEAEQRFDEE